MWGLQWAFVSIVLDSCKEGETQTWVILFYLTISCPYELIVPKDQKEYKNVSIPGTQMVT